MFVRVHKSKTLFLKRFAWIFLSLFYFIYFIIFYSFNFIFFVSTLNYMLEIYTGRNFSDILDHAHLVFGLAFRSVQSECVEVLVILLQEMWSYEYDGISSW